MGTGRATCRRNAIPRTFFARAPGMARGPPGWDGTFALGRLFQTVATPALARGRGLVRRQSGEKGAWGLIWEGCLEIERSLLLFRLNLGVVGARGGNAPCHALVPP